MKFMDSLRSRVRLDAIDVVIVVIVVVGAINALIAFWNWVSRA